MIKRNILVFVLIFLAVSLSYFNNLDNDFLWDDEFLIQKNSYLKSFSHLPKMLVSSSTAGFGGKDNFYRPTQNIFYLFIYQGFGLNKQAFHAGNIALHFFNACLIFLLTISLFNNRRMGIITSLLWALHPTHVEAITYISGTADPMGTLFVLSSLLALTAWQQRRKLILYTLSVLFFILALLSKEAMIVTPALTLIILALLNKEGFKNLKTYWPSIPFWFIAAGYMVLRKSWLNFDNTYNFYKSTNLYTENIQYRIYTYLATLPEYLKILFYPIDLHMERHFPVHTEWSSTSVLLGLAILVGSLILPLYLFLKYKSSLPLFSWLWYFIAFAPMMGILIPVNSFILEHWLYLPSIAVFWVVAAIIEKTKGLSDFLPWGMTLVTATFLMFLTYQRNQDWQTPIRFYNNILKYSRGSARVHNNLAMAYSADKNWTEAIHHYQIAIETADTYPQTHYNLARAYIQLQKYDQALVELNRSLQIDPNFRFSEDLKKKLTLFLQKKNRQ